MVPISTLSASEREILIRCLRLSAADQTLFPDWEFHTIFGLTRPEFAAIVETWPDLDASSPEVDRALNNTLNNLLGYPHDHREDWDEYFGFGRRDVQRIFAKLRGSPPTSYFDSMI